LLDVAFLQGMLMSSDRLSQQVSEDHKILQELDRRLIDQADDLSVLAEAAAASFAAMQSQAAARAAPSSYLTTLLGPAGAAPAAAGRSAGSSSAGPLAAVPSTICTSLSTHVSIVICVWCVWCVGDLALLGSGLEWLYAVCRLLLTQCQGCGWGANILMMHLGVCVGGWQILCFGRRPCFSTQ
jgi:hypothetical protein